MQAFYSRDIDDIIFRSKKGNNILKPYFQVGRPVNSCPKGLLLFCVSK